MTSTFGMFVKYPDPGRVKTRLAAVIGDGLAAQFYGAFLEDLIPRFQDIAARRILAYTPDDGRTRQFFQRLANGRYELWAQPDGTLGERMRSFFTAFGPEPAVLVGSDSPTLKQCDVQRALSALDSVDCVLGPATDGGVYLIGLRGGPWPIFDAVEWSTSRVLEQTIAAVQQSKAAVEMLPLWYDIDTLEDVHFLRGHLAALQLTQDRVWQEVGRTRLMLDVIDGHLPL